MPELLESPVVDSITTFLDRIGLPWKESTLSDSEFLPGIRLEKGVLHFDRARLKWPGDLLHEAGHVAVTAPSERSGLDDKIDVSPGDEMAALAWSYAAALDCGIDPAIVFHEGGYKSGGDHLLAQFASGQGVGVPMLRWFRMTADFPRMSHWLRELEDPSSYTPSHT